ncbi:MAG: NAD(P)/FAD-dependent oxidoreductase [Polyangiaceae bacterium]
MTKRAVVIGTGAGGLTAAVGLAQAGFEVVALEREKQLGGFLNPFKRKKFHFDPGVHYVGQCDPGGDMYRVLERCGLDPAAIMAPMDPECFDLLRFPDFEVKVPQGVDRYRANLLELFPEDQSDLDRYFAVVRAMLPLMRSDTSGARKLMNVPRIARLALETYGQYLDRTFENPRLRSVLGAQCGDYGLPPSQAPALLGVGLLAHYLDSGGWFPRGGSGSLRDGLVDAGRKLGVVYKRRAEVARIHTEGGRVSGVTLTDGEYFPADVVISNIDPTLTYGRLLDSDVVPSKLQKKVAKNLPSVGSLCLYYGMNRDLRQHGLGAFNVWDYHTWNLDEAFGYALRGTELPEDYAFFLSPNSLKDDTNQMAPEGMSTLEVVTLVPFAPFAKWQNERALKRGEEYEAFKAETAATLRAAVDRRWPGVIGDVVVEDVSTPLSNMHFAGVVAGGIYGPAVIPSQFGPNAYSAKSPVEGLFLAGSGVTGPGVSPCLASGIKAARAAAKSRSKRLGWLPLRAPTLARS